jgi:hypothetical protein
LLPRELVGTYANLAGTPCEIQVCSIMAHVWNEVEHDLGYKPTTGALSDAERELLVSLGHLTRSGDGILSRLFDATETRQRELKGPFEDVYDFVARMRKWLPGADLSLHAGQLFDELAGLGVTTPELVRQRIGGDEAADLAARARTELQTFSTYLKGHGHDRYALDSDSSDLLLIVLLPALAGKIVENHPTGRGVGGPPRVAWIASRFLESVAQQ